jgi:hypothetical protein
LKKHTDGNKATRISSDNEAESSSFPDARCLQHKKQNWRASQHWKMTDRVVQVNNIFIVPKPSKSQKIALASVEVLATAGSSRKQLAIYVLLPSNVRRSCQIERGNNPSDYRFDRANCQIEQERQITNGQHRQFFLGFMQ